MVLDTDLANVNVDVSDFFFRNNYVAKFKS